MMDASRLEFEENIKISKETSELAHKNGVTVEGELGKLCGQEDDIIVDERDAMLTNPDAALEFVKRTGVDSLAVAIGTAHGIYKLEPKLDFDRLFKISKMVGVPLVLHGASGISDNSIKIAIELGICKINIATELKIPFSDEIKAYFNENPKENDPRKYFNPAKERVKNIVKKKILVCGSANRK
jgi:tagatose 1,6-diphosphate aldolase GatY/KbaY